MSVNNEFPMNEIRSLKTRIDELEKQVKPNKEKRQPTHNDPLNTNEVLRQKVQETTATAKQTVNEPSQIKLVSDHTNQETETKETPKPKDERKVYRISDVVSNESHRIRNRQLCWLALCLTGVFLVVYPFVAIFDAGITEDKYRTKIMAYTKVENFLDQRRSMLYGHWDKELDKEEIETVYEFLKKSDQAQGDYLYRLIEKYTETEDKKSILNFDKLQKEIKILY